MMNSCSFRIYMYLVQYKLNCQLSKGVHIYIVYIRTNVLTVAMPVLYECVWSCMSVCPLVCM